MASKLKKRREKRQKVNDNNENVLRQCSFAESYTIGLTDFDFLVFRDRIRRKCNRFAKLQFHFLKVIKLQKKMQKNKERTDSEGTRFR